MIFNCCTVHLDSTLISSVNTEVPTASNVNPAVIHERLSIKRDVEKGGWGGGGGGALSKSDPQQKPTLQLWIAEMRHEMHKKFCQKVLRKSLALDNCALQTPPLTPSTRLSTRRVLHGRQMLDISIRLRIGPALNY